MARKKLPVKLRVTAGVDRVGPHLEIMNYDPKVPNFRCAMPSIEIAKLLARSVEFVADLASEATDDDEDTDSSAADYVDTVSDAYRLIEGFEIVPAPSE